MLRINKYSSQRAQSMIEYSLITILVLLGILIMGPYLIRSINSYFKSMDEGIEDSFSEDIRQTPPPGLVK